MSQARVAYEEALTNLPAWLEFLKQKEADLEGQIARAKKRAATATHQAPPAAPQKSAEPKASFLSLLDEAQPPASTPADDQSTHAPKPAIPVAVAEDLESDEVESGSADGEGEPEPATVTSAAGDDPLAWAKSKGPELDTED